MFLEILLNILSILAIIVFGALVVVVVADLILCLIDDHDGIIFKRRKKEEIKEDVVVSQTATKKEDIVVYNQANPNTINKQEVVKEEKVDGYLIEQIDYDKAVEEQKELASKKPQPQPKSEPKKVEKAPKQDDIFWDDDEDDFNDLLDEIIQEAKKSGTPKEVKKEEVVSLIDEETKKELDELRELKEQQKKEIEEFRQMKEDYAREKEEELAQLKENLDKAKEEELEKLRQDAIREQEKLEEMRRQLEEEKNSIEEVIVEEQEPIVKETIIRDDEELNKLKYKNLLRMNNRLTRIIRDTERLQKQKQQAMEKSLEQKKKIKQQEELERQKEQEKILKEQESLRIKNEINAKLNNVSNRVSKYKLDSKKIKIEKDPLSNINVETSDKEPIVATPVPAFEKEYYEKRLVELDEELKEAEKELRLNKAEYIPLVRIHKAYDRDSERLRKKELQVAKQKVAIYGVNSSKVDMTKKEKLDANLTSYAELKDSVRHCEEVIKKNKDRYPVLEKNNKLITKQIQRINDDIKVCEKAIAYYNKKSK